MIQEPLGHAYAMGYILDARRGQVYGAAFRAEGGAPVRLMDDVAVSFENYAEVLPEGRLLFVGARGGQPLLGKLAQRFHADLLPSSFPRLFILLGSSRHLILSLFID